MQNTQTVNQYNLRILVLRLRPVAGCAPQYLRPWTSTLDGDLAQLLQAMQEVAGDHPPQASELAGAASQLLQLSAEATPADIPGGWAAPRFAFELEVEIVHAALGHRRVELFTGFTDSAATAPTGEPDPEMQFFITRVQQLGVTMEQTPTGLQPRLTQVGCNYVLADPAFQGMFQAQKLHRLRPSDVFTGLSALDANLSDAVDLRTAVTCVPALSSALDVLPTVYLHRVIHAMRQATLASQFGHGPQELYAAARGVAQDQMAIRDPFLSYLTRAQGGAPTSAFRWKDLEQLAPVPALKILAAPAVRDDTEFAPNNGRTAQDVAAATLLQGGLALTAVCGFERLRVRARYDPAGVQQLTLGDWRAGLGWSAESEAHVLMQLEHHLLKDLTQHGLFHCTFEAAFDTVGDCTINLSWAGQPERSYCLPAWAAAGVSPLLQSSQDGMYSVVHDLGEVLHLLPGGAVVL